MIGLLIAGGAGFVLGSKVGRGPYDMVARQVDRLAQDPRVRQRVSEATGAASRKAGELTRGEGRKDSPTATPGAVE